MPTRDPAVQEALDACIDAYVLCKETIAFCLEAGGAFEDGRFIVALLTCSDTARTTAEYMVIEPDLAAASCGFCAIVCDQTAYRCDSMPYAEQLELCGEGLRRTASLCRSLTTAGLLPSDGS